MTVEEQESKPRETPESVVLRWWEGLKENKGGRAMLRRAHSLSEVLFVPAYHDLLRRLKKTGWYSETRVALIAGVLAHVKDHDPSAVFAAQLAAPKEGRDNPRFSDKRFRRLVQNQTHDELFNPVIRAVRQIDGRANVADLANGLYWWNDRVRREWIFAYYEKAPYQQ